MGGDGLTRLLEGINSISCVDIKNLSLFIYIHKNTTFFSLFFPLTSCSKIRMPENTLPLDSSINICKKME